MNGMSRLYLITGFLGAGKTTFLRNFIRLFPGERIQLIINEFGKEGVDGVLLADLDARMREIAGGSVFCSCWMDQFEKALGEVSQTQADVIIVEASGLSNPTGVRKLFREGSRFPGITYRGALCLIDAVRFPKQYATARTCVKQLASSDVAVVNKTDRATGEQLEATLRLIRGQRPEIAVLETSYGQVGPGVLDLLARAQAQPSADMPLTADLTLIKLTVRLRPGIPAEDLRHFIEMFIENTFRVKGFLRTDEGMVLADCVGSVVTLTPWMKDVPEEKVGCLTVLSGSGMPVRRAVREAVRWYPEQVLCVE